MPATHIRSLTHVKVITTFPVHTGLITKENGKPMKKLSTLTLAALLSTAAVPALAQSQGDMYLGLGLGWIEPDGSSNTAAGSIDVDGAASATFTFEYFIADRIGIEVLASYPFEHDINLAGSGKVGTTKHLPPTVSLQYYFDTGSSVTPFIGAGINYTYFFDEDGKGALAGTSINLDDSWGLALHAGADFDLNEKSALRVDVRYIDIETDVEVGGADIGKVKIDPWVFGASYIIKF